ncbi:MAG: SoxR reducing system RseC family protein [Filifactoraceae bacterium]
MREEGSVTKIDGDYAYVLIKRHAACGKCKACELGIEGRNEIEVKTVNKENAEVGDRVSVILESPDVLKAAFIVYMIPLICFSIGWFLSWVFGVKEEMTNLFVGSIFMGAAFIFVKFIDRKMARTKKYEPILSEIIKK